MFVPFFPGVFFHSRAGGAYLDYDHGLEFGRRVYVITTKNHTKNTASHVYCCTQTVPTLPARATGVCSKLTSNSSQPESVKSLRPKRDASSLVTKIRHRGTTLRIRLQGPFFSIDLVYIPVYRTGLALALPSIPYLEFFPRCALRVGDLG